MRVCIVVDSDVIHDSRVLRVSKSLSKKYEVVIVGFAENKIRYKNLILTSSTIYNILRKFINDIRNFLKIEQKSEIVLREDENRLKSCIGILISDVIKHLGLKMKISSINKELSKISADVYHANDLPVLKICMKNAKKNNSKLIYDSHELYLEQGFFKTKFLYNKYFYEEKEGIKRADAVITVNEFIAKELGSRYNCNNISVIYNYPQKVKKYKVHEIVEHEEIRLLYQGMFAPGRGLKELVLAMEVVPNCYKLYLRGMGSYGEFLMELAKKMGLLNNKVFFLEPASVEELVPKASYADVGILLYEPYCLNNYFASPNKLFEYLHAGLAILCNRLPFLEKIVTSKNVGVVVEELSPESIARGIKKFNKNNLIDYKRLAIKAGNEFVWESEEKKLLSLYASLRLE